jgi:hydrogenase nickel incorporation protein HypA/HybF
MHELSVCYALLAQVEAIARSHHAMRVSSVHLDLGPLSGVEPELLRRAFPLAAAGTVAEAADLVIGTCDVRVRCTSCGAESRAAANRLLCGKCGDWRTTLLGGDELMLQSVALESTQAARDAAGPAAGTTH